MIEDHAGQQEALSQVLETAGFRVEVADTGAAALAACTGQVFDAVTLDLLLPDMSGLDLLAGIRASGINRDTPVIVVTVIAEKRAVAGVRVHDVLGKPVDPRALLDSLERAGVRPRRASGSVVDGAHRSFA